MGCLGCGCHGGSPGEGNHQDLVKDRQSRPVVRLVAVVALGARLNLQTMSIESLMIGVLCVPVDI